jgi:ABC-2 type transport system ATP-binding protein
MTNSIEISNLDFSVSQKFKLLIPKLHFVGPGWCGLFGSNGSGKSTLLNVISGRKPFRNGNITINRQNFGQDRKKLTENIGMALEIGTLPNQLTGHQILTLIAHQFNRLLANNELEPLADALGISSYWHEVVSGYSSGMKQRIAIFGAFVGGHKIVFLDEPFNWLDPVCAYDVKAEINNLCQKGHLVVSAIHDTATIVQYCTQAHLIAEGEIVFELSKKDLQVGRLNLIEFERTLIDKLRFSSRSLT